jgi:hypothetical protein
VSEEWRREALRFAGGFMTWVQDTPQLTTCPMATVFALARMSNLLRQFADATDDMLEDVVPDAKVRADMIAGATARLHDCWQPPDE